MDVFFERLFGNYKRVIAIFILLVSILAIPVTLALLQQPQELRQQAATIQRRAPSISPSSRPTCASCRAENQSYLCFDTVSFAYFCSDSVDQDFNVRCSLCSGRTPTPIKSGPTPSQSLPTSKPSPSQVPSPTCMPRPACLDAVPRCLLPEPVNGWCPNPSITKAPCPTPPTCTGTLLVNLPVSTSQIICPIYVCRYLEPDSERICIQVITPARNPVTRECRNFPTPCDVLPGWEKVPSCDNLPESTPPLSVRRTLVDIDKNNTVDLLDFNIIIGYIRSRSTSCPPQTDIDGDGKCDEADLNYFLREFTIINEGE